MVELFKMVTPPPAPFAFRSVSELADGQSFFFPITEWNPYASTCDIVGWTRGVKLYGNASRVRVKMEGGQKQVVFGDGEKRREFESHGKIETNWPVSIDVVPVDMSAEESQARRKELADREARTMAANQKAMQAKLTFQHKALTKAKSAGASDEEITLIEDKIAAIYKEAEAAGVELTEPEEAPAATTPAKTAPATTATTKPAPAASKAAEETQTDETAQAEAEAKKLKKAEEKEAARVKREAEKAAAKAAREADKEMRRKAKAADSTRGCLCGCGAEVGGLFKPGHDARVKGWLLAAERGLRSGGVDTLPETLKPYVEFTGDEKTAGKDDGDFTLVKAPVRFPGRPEIEYVDPRDKKEAEAA